ncbi:MAG: transcriptional regulator [Chloroflexi bacterium]|nr:transcriptional regulator [Chloroflexota bacterium]MBT3668639.1 transcriptional regulator [Chloroflexota bacterium]MBT4002010.1 transcriptional regulator [Chloroflexota bacterium]MBT4304142.1 transcriptional regulator [Chloroflexota bacterium]MBT4533224.1 transcriptional regulator [Chloroflexota bacterium]
MTYLYVVNRADYVFLMHLTGLTWGNIASHIGKLEEANYVEIEKKFVGKKPHSLVKLTPIGKSAYKQYKKQMQETLNNLP